MWDNVIGYARVSSAAVVGFQADALVAAGNRGIPSIGSSPGWHRKHSHETRTRPLPLQPGTILTVADLTRVGRSTADLTDIVTVLGRRGIAFRSLAEPWLDTAGPHGQLIFDYSDPLRSTKRSRLSERTWAPLAAAKAHGQLGGRPRTMTPSATEAARQSPDQGLICGVRLYNCSASLAKLSRSSATSSLSWSRARTRSGRWCLIDNPQSSRYIQQGDWMPALKETKRSGCLHGTKRCE